MGKIKGWKKEKETPNYLSYRTLLEKDHNVGLPSHLRSSNGVWSVQSISMQKQWYSKDIVANNTTDKNAVWVVRFFTRKPSKTFKTKAESKEYMMNYMRSHPW